MTQKKIQDIEKGMVFDHLALGTGEKVIDILKKNIWPRGFAPIIVGSFRSRKLGKKDVAKLDSIHLNEGSPAMNDIALLSPYATISWIENGAVKKKQKAWACMADVVESCVVPCANHNCISSEEAPEKFVVVDKKRGSMKCYYCEREFSLI